MRRKQHSTGGKRKGQLFSLPKNVTKLAVRNFLLAFSARGELINSLLLPGGSKYQFKICFLVFFPSFARLRARRPGPEYFFSLPPPLRRRSGPLSSLSCDLLPRLNFARNILFR